MANGAFRFTCLLATALLVAHLYVMNIKEDSEVHQLYLDSLTSQQRMVYAEIKQERLGLYLQGLALGLILGALFLSYSGLQGASRPCLFVLLVEATAIFYYRLSPKKHQLMVNYLTDSRQIDLWSQLYQEYQKQYYSGMLVGAIGFLLLLPIV